MPRILSIIFCGLFTHTAQANITVGWNCCITAIKLNPIPRASWYLNASSISKT